MTGLGLGYDGAKGLQFNNQTPNYCGQMKEDAPVTKLLVQWRSGDEKALSQLTPIIYDTLRRLSQKHIRREANPTIQATELVHEAFLNLVDVNVDWQDRAHFMAVASRLMRRLLIDRARARLSKKRGGHQHADIEEIEQLGDASAEQEVLELDDALTRLKGLDERKADVLELHFFGGLTYPEIGEALGISEATVDRDLRFAKSWVFSQLNSDA